MNGQKFTLDNFNLLTYDTIFKGRNTHTPAYIRIALSGSALDKNGGIVTLTLYRNTTIENNEMEKLSQYFSSVINFTFGVNNNICPSESTEISTLYETAKNSFAPAAASALGFQTKVFPTKNVEDNTWVKSDFLTFEYEYTKKDWNSDILNLYLKLDYSEELVNSFISTNNIDTSSLHNQYSTFENDLSSIVIGYRDGD